MGRRGTSESVPKHAVRIIDGVAGDVGSELTVEVSLITPSLVGGVNKEFQPTLHISPRYKQLVNKSADLLRPQDIGVRGNGDTRSATADPSVGGEAEIRKFAAANPSF